MAAAMIPPPATDRFLASCGWEGAEVTPLAGDASFRRYFRVASGERRAVLMDAPPPHEDPRPFVAVAEWLGSVGLKAPEVLARDMDRGLLLLSDLGEARMREWIDSNPGDERALYELAVDLLIKLHECPAMGGLPPHGIEQWLEELRLFTDWYCPAVGVEADCDAYLGAWRAVLSPVDGDGLGPVTVLRDFHAENVMLIDGANGIERLGLLDFQDALAGHPAYDLASVLEDARRDVSENIERDMLDRYIAASGSDERFERAYWALAAQRNTRILGVFTRLWKRDGKPQYRKFQSRMWGLLERDLTKPGLEPVREWFDRYVRHEHRRAPWLEPAE